MRNRIFAVFALAVLAGGGLAYATYNFMQNQPVKAVAAPTQPVVVAAADLRLGAELKQDDLRVINFPQGQAPEGAFSQVQQVIGRGLIVPIVKNELILDAKLASKESGSGLPPVTSCPVPASTSSPPRARRTRRRTRFRRSCCPTCRC
jgi:Flp pilus assembly protein CpaB